MILLDPQYDAYAPIVRRVGGVIVTVKLDEEDWSIPREALAAAFSPRTKLIVINTPHNPTGKVGTSTHQCSGAFRSKRAVGQLQDVNVW